MAIIRCTIFTVKRIIIVYRWEFEAIFLLAKEHALCLADATCSLGLDVFSKTRCKQYIQFSNNKLQ